MIAVAKEAWIPATPGTVPPSGWILVRETGTGKEFWADPKTLKRGPAISELSAEQHRRIERVAAALQEHDASTLAEWLDNMSRDHHPEVEISIWERVASVYEAEVKARPRADQAERHLIYGVLVSASMLPSDRCTAGTILSMFPAAKGLADLERVINSYRETTQSD
jgi:hypothetical protein